MDRRIVVDVDCDGCQALEFNNVKHLKPIKGLNLSVFKLFFKSQKRVPNHFSC